MPSWYDRKNSSSTIQLSIVNLIEVLEEPKTIKIIIYQSFQPSPSFEIMVLTIFMISYQFEEYNALHFVHNSCLPPSLNL